MAKRKKKSNWVYSSAGGALGYGTGESLAEYLAKRSKKFKKLGRLGRMLGAAGGTLLGTLIGQGVGKLASDPRERLLHSLVEFDKSAGRPSAGMTKRQKSSLVRKAREGKDIGKPGKNFKAVAAKAAKRYGSAEAGRRVAAAAMWKNRGK